MNEIKKATNILRNNRRRIILLHCNTEYPTPYEDINLNAMTSLEKFNPEVGYSDHSLGTRAYNRSFVKTTVIEKHFTISKK